MVVMLKVCRIVERSWGFWKTEKYTLLAYFDPDFDTYLFCNAGKTAHQPGERGGLCCVLRQMNPTKPKDVETSLICWCFCISEGSYLFLIWPNTIFGKIFIPKKVTSVSPTWHLLGSRPQKPAASSTVGTLIYSSTRWNYSLTNYFTSLAYIAKTCTGVPDANFLVVCLSNWCKSDNNKRCELLKLEIKSFLYDGN